MENFEEKISELSLEEVDSVNGASFVILGGIAAAVAIAVGIVQLG